jgi:pyridoxamine 5'-phosphate oxidase
VSLTRAELQRQLAEMRRSYALAGLAEADLAPDWTAQFARWIADARDAGLAEPNAMVFATAAAGGLPSARTVLLKAFDERGFVLFTHLTSRKGREALENPQASLVFPWYDLERQVTVTGTVEQVTDAEADAYFARRPRGSQLGALASPQSEVVPSRAVLEAAREELARRYPEGTAVPRPERWSGLRVLPITVEFWQGREDRLHDRLRFRRDGDAWVLERLAP